MSIAGELIERGWTKGRWDEGPVCLEGAALLAEGRVGLQRLTGYQLDALREASPALAVIQRILGRPAWIWNDTDGRTYDEVLRVAKEADEILGAA